MKKKIFSLLALVMTAMTASAIDAPSYNLTAVTEHGTVTFKVGENTVTTAKEGDVVTVSVEPATGYAVDEATGKWDAAVASSRRIPAAGTEIGLVSDMTLTPDNSLENTWSFTMERANAELSVNTGEPSARITIVFEDATKIANTNITNITNGDWYTIDGRKVNAPSKKGIYIMNGRKVVVK